MSAPSFQSHLKRTPGGFVGCSLCRHPRELSFTALGAGRAHSLMVDEAFGDAAQAT